MLTFTRPLAVMLSVLMALMLTSLPLPAYACSGDPFDPNDATVIAEGWVEQATLRPDLPSGIQGASNPKDSAEPFDPYVPVEVTLGVEKFHKGAGPNPLVFSDVRSVPRQADGSVIFAGNGGFCGILDADPAGKYALIVFVRGNDGRLLVNRIYGAAFGDSPESPQVQAFRQYIAQRLKPLSQDQPPTSGQGRAPKSDGKIPAPAPSALPRTGEAAGVFKLYGLIGGGLAGTGLLLAGLRRMAR